MRSSRDRHTEASVTDSQPGSSGVLEILASFTLLTNKYPHITFRATSISGQSGTFTVKGDLTIAGTSRPISLEVTVGGDGQVTVQTSVVQTSSSASSSIRRCSAPARSVTSSKFAPP
jgi:polyisoprenoid-binding protein YceI